jgi:hypothetical protein
VPLPKVAPMFAIVGAALACTIAWGLTYQTRQQNNYKDSSRSDADGMGTLRDLAHWATDSARERRRAASILRWTERRFALPGKGGFGRYQPVRVR